MSQRLICVGYAVQPGKGEDSFVARSGKNGSLLCVADGCGGLGSRRYEELSDHTGAFVAARLVTHAVSGWAGDCMPMPASPEEGGLLCRELEGELDSLLKGFASKHCQVPTRIVGSMQRSLPTTLCAATITRGVSSPCELCFVWAGDSRGYVLDEDGLHQCTGDHLRGTPDPFESLYRDIPLSGLISADMPARLSMRRLSPQKPCVVLTATDGVFGCLPTPMEFEMLLLDTLRAAAGWDSWERKLMNLLKKVAHDDATLLFQPCGFEDLNALQCALGPRRAHLQKRFITPVRRRRRDIAYARALWQEYRERYDWTEGGRHERADWRI